MDVRKPPQRATARNPKPKTDHVLFYGDNLDVLRDPKRIKDESVDLCYMDPPFNSKRNYNQIYRNIGEDRAQAQAFIDTWKWDDHARTEHRRILGNEDGKFPAPLIALIRGLHGVLGEGSLFAYLVGMAVRITEIRRVLNSMGCFYLHCDPTSSHYLKLICDAVFCANGGDFLNEIIWKRSSAHSGSKKYSPVHDTILLYSKSDEHVWNQAYQPLPRQTADAWYNNVEEGTGRRFNRADLTASGTRTGASGKPWRGIDPTTKGRHWAVPGFVRELVPDLPVDTQEALDRLVEIGRIHWPQKANGMPMLKRYLEEAKGLPALDTITDIPPLNNVDAERLGYPTQKPMALLERIISASSNANAVILDPCCGCGTTIAAAQKLGRRWIGIDITYQSISLVLRRLEDQVGSDAWPELESRIDQTGVPRDMESAVALAHKRDDRVRKEFEKWAVLTYTNNRALINEKKGADGGIDGRVYLLTSATTNAVMVLQAKSGIVNRGDISQLRGDMQREGAEMATLITLAKPTAPMIAEAKAAGTYHYDLMDRDYDRIRIVTVQEIIEDRRRLDIPLVKDTAKPAQRDKKKPKESLRLPGIDDSPAEEPSEITDMVGYLKRETADAAGAKPKKTAAASPTRKKAREA